MRKKYKAVFFDWDGTAVKSRKASAAPVIRPMGELLSKGIALIIISGTTYEKIAAGKIEENFSPSELQNLFLGLGRGAFNYRFDGSGRPFIWKGVIPDRKTLLKIHEACFAIHQKLLMDYGLMTDIVFSRPNYCKIDLMVENDRGNNLFLQDGEIGRLKDLLNAHGIKGGLKQLIALSEETAVAYGLKLSATCDAKFLEVGLTDKSDNTEDILNLLENERGISARDCCFWGDEYVGADEELFGSDSFMLTSLTQDGDFFDVSDTKGKRPPQVKRLGGGVETFRKFLLELSRL